MQISNKKSSPFLEKMIQFDFEKFYTPTNRIICHVLMWIFFTALLTFNYFVNYRLSFEMSFATALRGTINNILVFYIFFYGVVPIIIKSKVSNIVLVIICFFGVIYLWFFLNFIQYKILGYFELEIPEGLIKPSIKSNSEISNEEILSFKFFFSNAMPIITSFSPMFFFKILFDITRLFKRLIFFEKQTSDLKLKNLNIEKNFLKSQLNPNFLFNTLNNLHELVAKKDPIAPEVIINISDMMAYTLYESNTEKVTLEKELEFMQNYFNLEKIRHSAHKDITMELAFQEDIEHLRIAPLLCFTFMENAFKYGLKSKNNSFVRIKINVSNNNFYFAIVNDIDINSNETKTLGGIGINNIKKRLSLLYPDLHELKIEDQETQFFVSLTIKLI